MTTVADFTSNSRKVEFYDMFVKCMSLEDVTQKYWCPVRQTRVTWLRTVDFSILTSLSISRSFHSNNFRPHITFIHFASFLFIEPVESQYLDFALSIRFKTNCFCKQHFKVWGNQIRLLICPYFIDSGLVSTRNRIRPEYVYQKRANHSKLYTNQWFREIDKNNKNPVMTQSTDIIKLASLTICKINSKAFVEYCLDEFELQANRHSIVRRTPGVMPTKFIE